MLRPVTVTAAIEHLRRRTLDSLGGEIARLVYLAGTRDYNTGKYYHDGLALQFTQEVANDALARCHEEIFQTLVQVPLKDFVNHLEEYMKNVHSRDDIVSTWSTLEPYRVTIPLGCDPLSAKLFCSNFRIALAILGYRAKNRPKEN